MRWSGLALLVASLGAFASACTSDHDVLKKKDPGSGGSSGAAGGSGAAGAGGTVADAGGDVDVEPPGASVLTLMHGVVDAERVAFCFAKVTDGVAGPLIGDPVPSGGVHYGGTTTIASVTGVDLAQDDVQTFVVAADSADLTAKSCQALTDEAAQLAMVDAGSDAADGGDDAGVPDAGSDGGSLDAAVEAGPPPQAPAVRVGGLPALPAGTLNDQKSILLVAAGCMGAPGFVDTLDNVVCGIGYAPDKPTLAPVLVQLSRIKKIDRLGLSVVNAAIAGESIAVQSVAPPEAALPNLTVAQGVGVGENSPKPPNFAAAKAGLGFGAGDPTLEISVSGTPSPALSVPWKNGLAPAGTGDVENGETYAIVVLGPRVSVAVTKWWNPVGLSIVKTDVAP